MANINLLPDDLRDKEERELKAVRKKPKKFIIEMSSPQKERVDQDLRVSKPSLISRLFAKKMVPAKPLDPKPESVAPKPDQSTDERQEDKELHIPKVKSPKLDSKSSFSFGNKSSSKQEKVKDVETTAEVERVPKDDSLSLREEEKELKITEPEKKKKKFSFNLFKSFGSGKKKKKEKIKEFESKKDGKEKISGEDKKKREEEKVLGINLMPEDLAKHPELELPKKLFKGGVVIFISVTLVIATYLGITWYQKNITNQINEIETEIENLNKQIARFETKKIAAQNLQNKLNIIRQLLDSHVYWNKFFEKLEEYTITEVYFTNFSMVGQERLIISAVGIDYNSVAKQLVAFQNADDFIADVKIDSASADIDIEEGIFKGVSFNVNLEFKPGIFLSPIE